MKTNLASTLHLVKRLELVYHGWLVLEKSSLTRWSVDGLTDDEVLRHKLTTSILSTAREAPR